MRLRSCSEKGKAGWPGTPKRKQSPNDTSGSTAGLRVEHFARLLEDGADDPEIAETMYVKQEESLEAPVKLWEQRLTAVLSALHAAGARDPLSGPGCGPRVNC